MSSQTPWVYHRVYVEPRFESIEHLVAYAVPAVLAVGGFDRWFFLRYSDEGGIHVRLRLRAVGDPDALAAAVEPVLADGVAAADRATPGAYRPTIVPPVARSAAYMRANRPANDRVVRTCYEPEHDRFGSAMDTAERLFEASSYTALNVLAHERSGGLSRKLLVPALMTEVWRAFIGGIEPDAFWHSYAAYWLDQVPGLAERWQPHFVAKARELTARRILLASDPSCPIVASWREHLERAAHEFRIADERRPQDLAFHMIHLMNNRLGLMPIEEAYYATLLAQASMEEAA